MALKWPKQLSDNTQTRVCQQPNFTIKTVATIHSPQWIRNRTLGITMGDSANDCGNQQPQLTVPTMVAIHSPKQQGKLRRRPLQKTTQYESIAAQNAIGHHSQPKAWGRQQPQNTISEQGSQRGKTTPNSLCVSATRTRPQNAKETYPIPLCGKRE